MDANRTRFHVLLGRGDWSRCKDRDGRLLSDVWDASPVGDPAGDEDVGRDDATSFAWFEGGGEIGLAPVHFVFPAAKLDVPPTIDDRRGAAADQYGSWYFIDESAARVRVQSIGSGTTTDFWPAPISPSEPRYGDFAEATPEPAPAPARLSGLTVTDDHYLVVGTESPGGLLAFDLHAGGPPREYRWPVSVPFSPFDIAPAPGGGVFVLDRTNKRLWALDHRLGVIAAVEDLLDLGREEEFQPSAPPAPGEERRLRLPFPAGLRLDASSPVAAVDPVAVAVLPDGTVLVYDRAEPVRVLRYRMGTLAGSQVLEASGAVRYGDDIAFVAGAAAEPRRRFVAGRNGCLRVVEDPAPLPAHRLYVASADGNQAFAFDVRIEEDRFFLDPVPGEFLPMRRYGGKGLVAAGGRAFYDSGDAFFPLVVQPRPRYVRKATLDTFPLDGREPDCRWHRLLLDGCLPGDTAVTIRAAAADELSDLPEAAPDRAAREQRWAAIPPEPAPRRRAGGSELPFLREKSTSPDEGTFELLIQRARGRYLQLRIELSGNGRRSPRLHAMRVYYPRFSYLEHYLPSVYRDDTESASFTDRYLANIEGFYTAIEDRIAAAHALLDVRSAPADVLEWLTAWFGVAVDPSWDEARRRLFIRHAMDFFRYRGTARGIEMALRLALEPCADERVFTEGLPSARSARPGRGDRPGAQRPAGVRIVERFRARKLPLSALGEPTPEPAGIRVHALDESADWKVEDGGAALLARYNKARAAQKLAAVSTFPLTAPDGAEGALWRGFAGDTLGFVPVTDGALATAWREFLRRRYRRIETLAQMHVEGWTDFSEVTLPTSLPHDGAALADWHHFQRVVVPIRQGAHRFTVLLPVTKEDAFAVEAMYQRKALAERIVTLEKPAHTVFTVKHYWAMFRVDEARLGFDTRLDRGSRAPELRPRLVLGRAFLAENHLAPPPAEDARSRQVLGRDPLATRHPSDLQGIEER